MHDIIIGQEGHALGLYQFGFEQAFVLLFD